MPPRLTRTSRASKVPAEDSSLNQEESEREHEAVVNSGEKSPKPSKSYWIKLKTKEIPSVFVFLMCFLCFYPPQNWS